MAVRDVTVYYYYVRHVSVATARVSFTECHQTTTRAADWPVKGDKVAGKYRLILTVPYSNRGGENFV